MSLEKSIVAIIILAVVAFAAYTWQEGRSDRAQLQDTIDSQQQIITSAESREQDRDNALKTTLAQIAATKKSIQTPQQIVSALPQYLNLPEPITLSAEPSATQSGQGTTSNGNQPQFSTPSPNVPTNLVSDELVRLFSRSIPSTTPQGAPQTRDPVPTPSTSAAAQPSTEKPAPSPASPQPSTPASAVIPAADLKPLFDYIQDCRSCRAQLTAAKANLSDQTTQIKALTQERDAAIQSTKGGTLWHRIKHNAKWLAAGAALASILPHLH